MSTPMERQYLELVFEWLVTLPHDLKVLFEAKDDPNLDRGAREFATGAIVYILSTETNDFTDFADDAVFFRLALRQIAALGGEGASDFQERFSEHYSSLDKDLDVCREAMGDTWSWLTAKLDTLPKQVYKAKKLLMYLDDDEASELLYDDGLAFATNYPVDEEKLKMRLKKPETLLEPLRRRAADERKKIS